MKNKKLVIIGIVLILLLFISIILINLTKREILFSAQPTLNITAVTVDNNLEGAHDIALADIDNDGKIDIISDAYLNYSVNWYKQINPTSWTKYTIDDNLTNAHDIQVGDIDGDGKIDIIGLSLSGSSVDYNLGNGTLVWYKNPIDPTDLPTWNKTIINTGKQRWLNNGILGARSLSLKDMDGDGDLDIGTNTIPGGISGIGYYIWYERINSEGTSFIRNIIDDNQTRTGWAHDIKIKDIDGDGTGDLVGSGAVSNMVMLYYLKTTAVDGGSGGGSGGGGGGGGASTTIYEGGILSGLDLTKSLKAEDSLTFTHNSITHTAKVKRIGSSDVDVEVSSTPTLKTISVGETKNFDVDEDNNLDLSVTLNKIIGSTAELTFKKYLGASMGCSETWTCSDWDSCTADGTRTRTCTDSNTCVTTADKPIESEECTPERDVREPSVSWYGGLAIKIIAIIVIISAVVTFYLIKRRKTKTNRKVGKKNK